MNCRANYVTELKTFEMEHNSDPPSKIFYSTMQGFLVSQMLMGYFVTEPKYRAE